MNANAPTFITIKDICAQTGFTASAIYQQIKKKKFPNAVKWGRLSKWLNDDVQRVLDARAKRKSEDEVMAIVAEINARSPTTADTEESTAEGGAA